MEKKAYLDDDILGIRATINKHAQRLDSEETIKKLSNKNAIRFLQEKEGYTVCFGDKKPLKSDYSDKNERFYNQTTMNEEILSPSVCSENRCAWKGLCDSYRNDTIPIDGIFESEEINNINSFADKVLNQKEVNQKIDSSYLVATIPNANVLSSISKKLLLISPKTLIKEDSNRDLRSYILKSRIYLPHITPGGTYPIYHYDITTLRTSDISSIYNWMNQSEKFINRGDFAYFPYIETHQVIRQMYKFNTHGEDYFNFPSFYDFNNICSEDELNRLVYNIPIDNEDILPLFNAEIPAIENTDFETLFSFSNDYFDELCSFRDFLYKKMILASNQFPGTENIYSATRLFNSEIHEELKNLKANFKKRKIKSIISSTSIAIGTSALSIYALMKGDDNLLKFIGPGGIVVSVGKMLSDYLINSLELHNKPIYFLWLLDKNRKS